MTNEKTLIPGQVPLRTLEFEADPIAGNKRRFDILGSSRLEMGSAMHYLHEHGGGQIKQIWKMGV